MKKLLTILSCLLWFIAPAQFIQSQQTTHSVYFGANIQGVTPQEELFVIKRRLGLKYVRHEISLINYQGGVESSVKRIYDSAMCVLLNVDWSGGGGAQGPHDFPTNANGDLPTFKTRLSRFIRDNMQYLQNAVFVIENEPYNSTFYNYDDHLPFMKVTDYINELSASVDTCRRYNIPIMDGATHMTYYSDIEHPPISGAGAKRGDSAFTYYSALRLNWYNYHFNAPSQPMCGSSVSSLTNNVVRNLSEYATGRTLHNPASNEWHQQDEGTQAQQNSLCVSIVTQTRQAHARYGLIFSGGPSSEALPVVDVNTLILTSFGAAYRDAIASGQ